MCNEYRWNFEKGSNGEILRCINDHEKGQPCIYEPLTIEEVERLTAKIAKQAIDITTLKFRNNILMTRVSIKNQSLKELIRNYSETWDLPILQRAEAARDAGKSDNVFEH